MALITADGGYHGWLGGNCTRPTVKREARLALADGKPRLVSLSPDPASAGRPGVSALPMTCMSGGTVEIYLEPVLPPPRLALWGESPAVRALEQLGKAMGWSIEVLTDARPTVASSPARELYAVVATMGENDEATVQAALAAAPAYLGVVASRKRFAEMRETLAARGVPTAALDAIRSPAGLDLGARRPEELALSILAEVVKLRAARDAERAAAAAPPPAEEEEAEDPVCHMTVTVATARHVAEHAGRRHYFCNPRCREKFLAQPARYLVAVAGPA
jgi:xanthine dehydrogenase accessory factor